MYLSVTSVTPLEEYKLRLKFSNGEERLFDLTPYLEVGKYCELKNITLFKTANVRFDGVEWANHLDIDPEFLYDNSVKIRKRAAKRRTLSRK